MTSPNGLSSNNLLFLGDSLVADNNWQPRIPLCTVHNRGVSGSTAQDLLESLPALCLSVPSPLAILVMTGTNDVLAERYSFVDTIRQIIVQLSKDFPMAEIIVTSLLPMKLPFLAEGTIDSLNDQIAEVTRQTGCCFLDMHKKFLQAKDLELFQEDGVHLTHRAYELWARTLLEHMSLLLEND